MPIPLFHVDAFTDRPFAGNPAAVCLLPHERPDPWLQSIAAEMNLSETAFVRQLNDGFQLRWFTPTVEVDLCGHATLASAHALWSTGVVPPRAPILFHTRSGVLVAKQDTGLIWLDFPATPVEASPPPAGLLEAIGLQQVEFSGQSKFDCFLVVDSAEKVRRLRPDIHRLADFQTRGVIVTARSDDPRFDFMSRFFCPAVGIDEDPVTGSAHCALAPYWGTQLKKTRLTAFQASRRGGIVNVEIRGDRVFLGGHAVTTLKGEILV